MNKTTVYLDAEEDITSVIDKISTAEEKVVALVPPKKMATLQSSVNLKLLQKIAKENKKNLVIISKEKAFLPLAGAVGMHVADTLNSRPHVPTPPDTKSGEEITIGEDDVVAGASVPVGILDKTSKKDGEDKEAQKPKEKKKKSKFIASIPNFGKFRLKLFLSIFGVIAIAVGWYVAYVVMPKAFIEIEAQTTKVPVNFVFTLDETIDVDDVENNKLKPVEETYKTTDSTTVAATGEENVGEKATGEMTVRNCTESDAAIASGTTFTSGEYQFTANTAVTAPAGTLLGGFCVAPGTITVTVTASGSGGAYNLAAGTTYTVSGFSGSVIGVGDKMSGGTDVFKKVVSQSDIDKAAKELEKDIHDDAIAELEAQFTDTIVPISDTFTFKAGEPKSVPAAGEEGEEATVTLEYTYTMQGVSLNSLSALIDSALEQEVENTELSIYDNGLDSVTMTVVDEGISASTNGFVGPELDKDQLAEEVSGKGVSEIRNILKDKPGVSDVTVRLEPLWVFRAPSADKITIDIVVNEHALQ